MGRAHRGATPAVPGRGVRLPLSKHRPAVREPKGSACPASMGDKWLARDLRLGPYLGCIRVRDKVRPYYWTIVGHVLYAPAAR